MGPYLCSMSCPNFAYLLLFLLSPHYLISSPHSSAYPIANTRNQPDMQPFKFISIIRQGGLFFFFSNNTFLYKNRVILSYFALWIANGFANFSIWLFFLLWSRIMGNDCFVLFITNILLWFSICILTLWFMIFCHTFNNILHNKLCLFIL